MAAISTQETIQKVVEEGLEARNLLNFISDGTFEEVISSKKPPVSPRPQSVSPKPVSIDPNKNPDARILLRSTKRRGVLSRPKSRLRSASAGRNPEKDLRARYWTFLFENLHRAVDEIYQTCEMDESIVESKEAIMMLENYSKDFHALIQYININKNYEKTAPPNRPTSLAWEVRKSSPGKSLLKNVFIEKLTAGNSNAKKILCFDSSSEFNISSEAKNLPQIPSLSSNDLDLKCGESKSKMDIVLETSAQIDPLTKGPCDVKISVVPIPTDEVFPCNQNLVVNEVQCQKSSPDPGTIMEKGESVLSTVTDEELITNPGKEKKVLDVVDNEIIVNSHESSPDISKVVTNEHFTPDSSKSTEIICSESLAVSCQSEESSICDDSSCKENNSPNILSVEPSLKQDSAEKSQPPDSNSSALSNNKNNLKNKENTETNGIVSDKVPSTVIKEKVISSKAKLTVNRNIKRASTTPLISKKTTDTSIKTPGPRESKSNVTVSKVERNSRNVMTKVMPSSSVKTEKVENLSSQKSVNTSTTIKPATAKVNSTLKGDVKPSSTADERKFLKTNRNESAIKRNISYVQSLSSRNQIGRLEDKARKAPSRLLSDGHKLKSGSMSSLNKSSTARNWAHKASSVEKIPEVLKSTTDEDSDGWEMVRGRNRCRNSPAKKLPFMNKNHENEVVHIAKLNQSRIGGFPYTTKVNGKVVNKNSLKASDFSKKPSNEDTKKEKGMDCKNDSFVCKKEIENSSKFNSTILNTEETSNSENGPHRNNSGDQQLRPRSSSERILKKEFLKLPSNVISFFEQNMDFPIRLQQKSHTRSSSAPSNRSTHDSNSHGLSKALCISDQYLGTQKYVNINFFKKKLAERSVSSVKRRGKKSQMNTHECKERNTLNGSLDESDTGLTSDDQEGPMSHDEAFDVQCQELYDTAWKYKILEQQVHKLELSWSEQMDRFDMELRTPGRALEMHEKLSSPFRKKSLFESIRVCNEKQLKAQEQRERLLVEKAQKFKIIQKKREEMRSLIEQRQEKQRILMEQKLQRAEEKRKKQLQMIIRKAHDEEEKVNEIAFINSLEAQNKRHDLISKEKDHEARLHDIQEERQRKQEEKAAKEAAAEGRRKILEAERQARLNEMQEKRKMRDHKVEQLFLVKEKERQELANQKARDREQRISALNAQQQISIEELQKKIQLKQEESARRHEENMEQIRQKAFELSVRKCSSNNDDVPQPVPYETKKICSICNVLIGSEVYLLSHLHGKKHQEAVKAQYQNQDPSAEEVELYNLKHIVDASTDQLDPNITLDKERQKALKKRCKKLRQRMYNRGQEYESSQLKNPGSMNSNMKVKMEKIRADIKKFEGISNDSSIYSALERSLNEIISIYQKKLYQDKLAFQTIGGVTALINILNIMSHLPLENNGAMHKKILNHLSNTFESLIENSYEVCKFILFSNKIGGLLDFLIHRLNNLIPDNISQLMINQVKSNGINVQLDAVAGKLLHLLTNVLTTLSTKHISNADKRNEKDPDDFNLRVLDVISYIVSIGIVDKLSQFINCIQGPINNETEVSEFLLDCISFLSALIKLNSECSSPASNNKTEDSTQLIATFRVTNMVGSVSLLYGLLLHSGASCRTEGMPPPSLPKQIEVLAYSTLCMLNHMAVMSLQAFQSVLGSEGLSLQLRHITSHLLWYCNHLTSEALLHEIILLVGYFTVLNPENQSIIQAGQRPTVLQQLCCLPFLYFSDSELTDILFPTLIACCYKNPANKTILQQEMTSELLSNYIEVKYLNSEENSLKKSKTGIHDKRWLLPVRFPKCHWTSAKHYFSND
ncbi:s phase cyclin A-associated protein in the endoplasmic reticulum [Trichonephila clavata]|uniref:S phase cyclin A-associated protein in the endoplasmic reticulum n=1 Tax=Trichonephila clavata TaxID=2740835 RepID=A0A8X6JLP1_TRICU|nr:s phase cyclin A-associated protein in the endoplasmic reticulum [Trichonephila clavata]